MKAPPPFILVYEDDSLIAVNKASGIATGGDRWDDTKLRLDTLVSEAAGVKVFTVHRIDKETSGLVVFAKNEAAHRRFSLAFAQRDVAKRYLAIVHGRPSWKETNCNLPLIPNGNKQHMTIVDKYRGKPSLTRFIHVHSAGNYSVLEAFPETGRTHQIRVHAAALGLPVACDPLYGRGLQDKPVLLSSIKKNWRGDPFDEKPLLSRLGLHALELTLPSGAGGPEPLTLHAPLPRDMAAVIKQLSKR